MRLRLFPLLLIPLIALWKINDLSRPDGISKLIGDREEPAGRRLFASEEHQNTVFTVENVNYKWTTIHANILEEETGRYMEVLSFLEGKETHYRRMHIGN